MHKIYTDGAGDGRMAWYNETLNRIWFSKKEGITSNQAEYMAVIDALTKAEGKEVEILSDSKLVVNQLNREWHIKKDEMRELFNQVQKIINERGLKVKFTWIERSKNKAGKYLG